MNRPQPKMDVHVATYGRILVVNVISNDAREWVLRELSAYALEVHNSNSILARIKPNFDIHEVSDYLMSYNDQ